jgi:hypothetical protein
LVPAWSLFSSHGLVLLSLARQPDQRLRDLADEVGLTERSVQAIVSDLVAGGYLERTRDGRRNRYLVRGDRSLGQPFATRAEVTDFIHAVVPGLRVTPSDTPRQAVVLACSDDRYQGPLRHLLAVEGILERAEVVLWPGGGSAVAGPAGPAILDALELVSASPAPARLMLVAHQDCRVPGAFLPPEADPVSMARAVVARRQRTAEIVWNRLGIEPEVWFLDKRGPTRVAVHRVAREDEQRSARKPDAFEVSA